MRRRFNFYIYFFLIFIGLAIFLTWATLIRESEVADTVTIGRGDIEVTVTALGVLKPRNYVDIGAQVSGQIRRIHVDAGDVVKKGSLLAEIDPRLQQAAVDTARAALAGLTAELKEQRAQYELAQLEYVREQKLIVDSATSERDLQIAHATVLGAAARIDKLKAQINGARSTLRGEETQLGYTSIYAPMSGAVVTLDAQEGQTLNAVQQTPLILRIADLSTMTVWTEVSEADIRKIRPGMPVYFTTLGNPNNRWKSRVRRILPAPPNSSGPSSGLPKSDKPAGAKVVLYTVLFDIENGKEELMAEMSTQVFFVVDKVKNVVIAPLRALQAIDGESNAYTARVLDSSGEIVERKIAAGTHDRLQVEVLSGLAPGDALVTATHSKRGGKSLFRW